MPTSDLEAAASIALERPWRPAWECARCHLDGRGERFGLDGGPSYCKRCWDVVSAGQPPPPPTPRPALRFAEERRAPAPTPLPAPPKEDPPVPTEGTKYKNRPCGCAPFGKHLRACPLKVVAAVATTAGAVVADPPPARRAPPLTPEMCRPSAVELAQATMRVRVPLALADAIRALLKTGLHGATEDECAERMLARGVEWTLNQRGGRP